jgi:hypothetical protein
VPGAGLTFSTPGAVLFAETGVEDDSVADREFLLSLQFVNETIAIRQMQTSRILVIVMG